MIDIKIEGLTKKFGDVTALDNINLDIASGELFFLLGPSGCGKTTLLRSLAGFYIPDRGKIFFGKKNVANVPPHKRQTGMVFQSYALWPHMTVSQNIAFGLEQKHLPKEKIAEFVKKTLESVQLDQYANRKPNELSGGQQQRVALARALIVRPRCLLLDEPLSNLDAQLRNEMRIEIKNICKESGLTTIYVTHDQKEALSIADKIAVFSNGTIQQIDTPINLYRRPQSKFVASFVGGTNIIDGVVMQIGAGEAFVRTRIGNFHGILGSFEKDPKPGQRVSVSIRPESLRITQFPTAENCIDGMIGNITYFGAYVQYEFEKLGIKLKLSETNPAHIHNMKRCNTFIHADRDDIVVLTK